MVFLGKLNLSTTSTSKVYVNLDIIDVYELIDMFIDIYLIILYDGLPMDFLFNSSLIMYRYRAIEDEGDNVAWHIPTRDKKPKSKS